MADNREDDLAGSPAAGGSFHILQPTRDLQSNWEVDLAKNLEEYLLKICSGELAGSDPDHGQYSVNFAQAALLLQNSIQVYSRKVEYLYTLVLHALEFLSEKRQDHPEKTSIQPDASEPDAVADDGNDIFLGLDDVPVEAKNLLDTVSDKDDTSNHFLKPPANLLVLEGDCLDTTGDVGELESYLLATCDFYRDFLLLDPCDAGAVYNFLKSNSDGKEHTTAQRGSSVRSKSHRTIFPSPSGKHGGTSQKSNLGKNQAVNPDGTSENNCEFEVDNDNMCFRSHIDNNYPEDDMYDVEEPNVGCSNVREDSDDDIDDPWKPLNPHEPGNLKVKPFRKCKNFGRQIIHNSKQNTQTSQFPIAKLEGLISPELAESFEVQCRLQERQNISQSPPLYEKLRRSLTFGEIENYDVFGGLEDENDDVGGENEHNYFEEAEFDPSNNPYHVETELPPHNEKSSDAAAHFDRTEDFSVDHMDSQASLEDLCRSHLDALLASIAETEKQTELAARVSTWKQRIEDTLEEQDRHPPFDIHQYGERILGKLSLEADNGGIMSFTDVVKGQPKHDVARTFSALLQLVNNGSVDLERAPNNDLVCYTAANPFHVRLLHNDRRRKEMEFCSSKKRLKSPLKKRCSKANPLTGEATSPMKSSHLNGRMSVKLGKGSAIRCTPEGKRRRRSRLTGPVDLQPAV